MQFVDRVAPHVGNDVVLRDVVVNGDAQFSGMRARVVGATFDENDDGFQLSHYEVELELELDGATKRLYVPPAALTEVITGPLPFNETSQQHQYVNGPEMDWLKL